MEQRWCIVVTMCHAVQLGFDKMVYVTGSEQDLHFQQLFHLARSIGVLLTAAHGDATGAPWADRCHHVSFGKVRGMSSRGGDVVFLDDVLNEARV